MAAPKNTRESVSQQQRQQGNLYFKSAHSNFAFVIRCSRLEAALQCYTNAFSSSLNDDDAVSAAKNVALTTWKLASLNAAALDRDLTEQKIIAKRYFSQALRNFTIAYQRRACKSSAWADHLRTSMEQCRMEAMEWDNTFFENVQDRDSLLSSAGTCLPDENVSSKDEPSQNEPNTFSKVTREMGNVFFRSACHRSSGMVKAMSLWSALGCYSKALAWSYRDEDTVSAAHDAAMASWRMAALKVETGKASDRQVIHDNFKDALRYFSKAHPKRLCRGQAWAQNLEQTIQECLDDIQTWITANENNVSEQAVALGEFLSYLLDCNVKARGYHHIVSSLFKNGEEALRCEEYIECSRYMEECLAPLQEAERLVANGYTDLRTELTALKKDVKHHKGFAGKCFFRKKEMQARQKKEMAEAREKETAMDELIGDLEELGKLRKLPVADVVEEIFKQWPPRSATGSEPTLITTTGSNKKILIRAISYYHPDKVDKKIHGIKWHFLCCEITKSLNMRLVKEKTSGS